MPARLYNIRGPGSCTVCQVGSRWIAYARNPRARMVAAQFPWLQAPFISVIPVLPVASISRDGDPGAPAVTLCPRQQEETKIFLEYNTILDLHALGSHLMTWPNLSYREG